MKERYLDRQYNKWEKNFIARRDDMKFLKRSSKTYGVYILLMVAFGLNAIVNFLTGFAAYINPEAWAVPFIFYFCLSGAFLFCTVMYIIQLPLYKRISEKCKEEIANKQ